MRLTVITVAIMQEMIQGNRGHVVSKSQLDQMYKNDNNQFSTYGQYFSKGNHYECL